MTIYELSGQSAWARRRRINRMLEYDKRSRTGVVRPDGTWQVILMVTGITVVNALLFVRWWLGV